ncbi:MAG: hypothetical protein GX957_08560 [Clostridiaceae bacterium]|nr:hypothetical protein [Clostridiaceae bacterium]
MKIIPNKYEEESNWHKWVKFVYSHGNKLSLVFLRRLAALARDLNHVMNGSYGYRPIEETQRLYNTDLKANGGKPSGKVALPGTSWHEHHLAIDLSGTYDNYWRNLSNSQWMNKSRLKCPDLNKYGLVLPLNKVDYPKAPEWWHLQPIETAIGIDKDKRKNFLDADDLVYGKNTMTVKQFQAAMKSIGLYTGALDDSPGALTRAAAKKIMPLLHQILGTDYQTAEEVIRAAQASPQFWIDRLKTVTYLDAYTMNIVNKMKGLR